MRDHDRKKLWARSGNRCSFPGCGVELVQEKRAAKVIGVEAHIRGEKPGAARYDPDQSPEHRESYENRILLCPTHHTAVDANPEDWTVQKLLNMKAEHERQLRANWRHPELVDRLGELFREYAPPGEFLDPVVSELVVDSGSLNVVRVDASREDGVNTHIKVLRGQRLVFFARGLVSYSSGRNCATPEGILCNEYGVPVFAPNAAGDLVAPVVWPHEGAYVTDGDKVGLIGSLYGWIDEYSAETAFYIGSKKEIEVVEDGYLFLAVNDAKGTYGDNDGEFRVDIQVLPS
jgi:hypothetical protein